MNISVSDEMHRFILARVRACGHSTVSEYIRSLVRRDGLAMPETAVPKHVPSRQVNDYFAEPDAAAE